MVLGLVKRALMRMARAILDNVLGQLLQQFNVIQEQALSPLRMIVQQVQGGVWRGAGADAFVNELSTLMIPGVGQVGDQVTTFSNNLQFARDVIDRADEAAERLVRSRLFDAFKFY